MSNLENTLKQLRLSGLLQTLDVPLQEAVASRLGHAEFLELFGQDEINVRQQRLMERRTKAADFRGLKTLEHFGWSKGLGQIVFGVTSAGGFLTGTAAGDGVISAQSAGKQLHLGRTTKVITVSQDNKFGAFGATPVLQQANTVDTRTALVNLGWMTSGTTIDPTPAVAGTISSVTTIAPTARITFISGTTAIATITVPTGWFRQAGRSRSFRQARGPQPQPVTSRSHRRPSRTKR
jgi:hypothetical protein